MPEPIRRTTARVLPVSTQGEVLLLQDQDPAVPYRSDSTFFGLLLDREVPISFEHLEGAEIGNVLAARWWFPDDLASAGGAVSEDMPAIMGAAVRAVLDGAR